MIYIKRTDIQRCDPCPSGEEHAKNAFGWFRWTFNIKTPIDKLDIGKVTNTDIAWFMPYLYKRGNREVKGIIDAAVKSLRVRAFSKHSKYSTRYWLVPVHMHRMLVKNLIKEVAK